LNIAQFRFDDDDDVVQASIQTLKSTDNNKQTFLLSGVPFAASKCKHQSINNVPLIKRASDQSVLTFGRVSRLDVELQFGWAYRIWHTSYCLFVCFVDTATLLFLCLQPDVD